MRYTVTVCLFVLSSACSTTAKLYPVEGPLSKSEKSKIYEAEVSGVSGNSGEMKMQMDNGVECNGNWSSAAGSGTTLTTGSLFGQYGSTYGTAVSSSTGTGQNPGRAVMQCSDGNLIDIEFLTGSGTSNGFGFAKDKKGNVFRMLF
jgi:hypothetical protein